MRRGYSVKKIGIIACANTTKILDCPLSPCLRDFYDRKGEFARYKGLDTELAGIISCQGCLGGLAPEAILSRANSLVHYGADTIHLTYCLVVLCPYVSKYITILKEAYPKVEIIPGTHEPHASPEKIKESISRFLRQKVGQNIFP
jgi:predicted metal-binding protein